MPLFADDGTVIDREALRSVQFNGQGMRVPRTRIVDDTKVEQILHEADGSPIGELTHHASGQIDAVVNAPAAQAAMTSTVPQ